MDRQASTYRTDEQLLAVLDDTADWVVNDAQGIIIGSIQGAGVIVFRDQMDRLAAAG